MARSYKEIGEPKWTKIEFGLDFQARQAFVNLIKSSSQPHSEVDPTKLTPDEINSLYGFICLGRNFPQNGSTGNADNFFAVALFNPPLYDAINLRVSLDAKVFPDRRFGTIDSLNVIARR
jgi:hypothetical protein